MNQSAKIVLIGFAEALSAPEVAWSLVEAGFEVTAFARKGRDSALRHSRFVKVYDVTAPETNIEASTREIAALLNSQELGDAPGLLLPLDDPALWLCSRIVLPQKCILAGPKGAAAELAISKPVQLAMARETGFRVPQTIEVGTRRELLACDSAFPVILKPAQATVPAEGRMLKGSNWICADRQELEKASEHWREQYSLLVQPLIVGTGEGIFGLATPDGIEALSAHRRLRMMNPHGSGSSACVSQPVPESLMPAVRSFIKQSGWTGLFMIELLRDHAGTAWFVEFNGRPWGSMALSRRQGLEYPAWAAQLALDSGWHLNGGTPAGRKVVCRNLGRELMHLLFVLRGRKSAAIKEWPSFWRSAAGVLLISPHDSLYNFRRDDFRVFLMDGYCTIRDQLFKRRRREQTA
jgi:predicted ATP-grasp superfamily ATP-dependent carboligase